MGICFGAGAGFAGAGGLAGVAVFAAGADFPCLAAGLAASLGACLDACRDATELGFLFADVLEGIAPTPPDGRDRPPPAPRRLVKRERTRQANGAMADRCSSSFPSPMSC